MWIMNRGQTTYVSIAIAYLLLYRDMALQHTFAYPQFILLRATFQTTSSFVVLLCVYTFIQSACRTTARRGRDLQLWLISTASCRNTFKISIFWWWRASGREGGELQEGGGGRLRCTSSVYEAESKWLSERVRGCLWVWERKRERETVVMIDARLPPLCSSEWLQQKAQNNIPDSLLCFFLSPCVSASRRGAPLTALQRLCWGWAGVGSRISGCHQQVRVGRPQPWKKDAWSSINRLSWHHCSGRETKGQKKKKEKKGEEGGSIHRSRSGCNWSTWKII